MPRVAMGTPARVGIEQGDHISQSGADGTAEGHDGEVRPGQMERAAAISHVCTGTTTTGLG